MADDTTLLDRLRQHDETAFTQVYNDTWPMVRSHILKNSGTAQDAEDVFQDAFIAFLKKIREPEFVLTAGISTFLFAIVQKTWLYRLRQRKPFEDMDGSEEIGNDDWDEIITRTETDRKLDAIAEAMKELKEDCRKLLIDFYYLKKPLKEIADTMSLKEGFIRVKKGRCLEYLREKVSQLSKIF